MTRLIPGATTPLPSQIFPRTSFCQFCHRSSATWTKNTWKHQILAKSHTNYFRRLAAKFQQTAISSICLGAFKRFSAMISASFSHLISASERVEGGRSTDKGIALQSSTGGHQSPMWCLSLGPHSSAQCIIPTAVHCFCTFPSQTAHFCWLGVQAGRAPKGSKHLKGHCPSKAELHNLQLETKKMNAVYYKQCCVDFCELLHTLNWYFGCWLTDHSCTAHCNIKSSYRR